ncbi:hypothetical protein TrST_g1716 [Triparma strigata]|uniref:Uncharacterized protein n=1 Tax=Triparma strigata TaxID=1606541 RepID=A0A9W7BNH5_9STRA|nr:hypothetical protein TrST_g1716 [Triparma strigata]
MSEERGFMADGRKVDSSLPAECFDASAVIPLSSAINRLVEELETEKILVLKAKGVLNEMIPQGVVGANLEMSEKDKEVHCTIIADIERLDNRIDEMRGDFDKMGNKVTGIAEKQVTLAEKIGKDNEKYAAKYESVVKQLGEIKESIKGNKAMGKTNQKAIQAVEESDKENRARIKQNALTGKKNGQICKENANYQKGSNRLHRRNTGQIENLVSDHKALAGNVKLGFEHNANAIMQNFRNIKVVNEAIQN